MQNKPARFGPLALSSTLTTNILNPNTCAGGVNAGQTATYILIRHIRVVNKTSAGATCSFWIGATGANTAGTEFLGNGLQVAANSFIDWYGMCRLDVADYLVGGASALTTLTIELEGEIGVAG